MDQNAAPSRGLIDNTGHVTSALSYESIYMLIYTIQGQARPGQTLYNGESNENLWDSVSPN